MAKSNKNSKKINLKKDERVNFDNIIQDNSYLIREISLDVPYPLSKADKKIMNQMIDYVRSSLDKEQVDSRNLKPAYGISAIQLGHKKKLIYIRIENKFSDTPEEFALVNPQIIWKSKEESYLSSGEGCLSVKDGIHKGYVLRHSQIKIRAIDYFTDNEIDIEAKGLTSIVLQHEMDHLLGILFYDRINKLKPFDVPKEAIKIN